MEKATSSKIYVKAMQEWNVKSFFTFSTRKSSFVERKIRDIQSRLNRIFTERKKKVWIDKASEIESALNNTFHSRRPIDVTDSNSAQVFQTRNDDVIKRYDTIPPPKFKIGDYCRIARSKLIFQKL